MECEVHLSHICILLLVFSLQPASSLRLAGFTCPSGRLDTPGVLEDGDKLSSVCGNLSVTLGPLEDSRDKVSSLVVEFSHVPLPQTGEKIFSTDLGEDEKAVNVIKETGDSLPSKFSLACGSSYLVASIQNDKGEVAEFDGYRLLRPCQDSPALKLVISKADQVNNELKKGIDNPFKAMGINEMMVENGKDGSSTALEPRWVGDMPVVLAFFVPMEWGDADHILSMVGFNISAKQWFNNDAKQVGLLIEEGRRNLGMFDKPTYLHKSSLLEAPSSGVTPRVEPGQKLGKIDLDKTRLSESFNQWSGFLVVALDPLDSIDDNDRSDNYFVQWVNVNATREDGEWVGEEPECSVSSWSSPKNNKFGKDAFISYNSIYGEKEILFYDGDRKGLRQSRSTKDNTAKIINQVAAMDTLNIMEKCDMTMLRRYTDSLTPINDKIIDTLKAFSEKFKERKTAASTGDDHNKVYKQLVLISEAARILFEDDKMMKMIEKEIKKKIGREKGGRDRPGGGSFGGNGGWDDNSYGGSGWDDYGNGGGGWDDYSSGGDGGWNDGGWDKGDGSFHAGGWNDNSYGGNGDWSGGGWGDAGSSTGGGFGDDNWNDWSTTDGWGNWEGTTGGWEGTTGGWEPTEAPPSLDKLMEMDNEELMSSLQSMDVEYMKMLMDKHPEQIKERMKKLSPQELKKVMEAIKPMMPGGKPPMPGGDMGANFGGRPQGMGSNFDGSGGKFGGMGDNFGGMGGKFGGVGGKFGGIGGKDGMGDKFGGGGSNFGGMGGKEKMGDRFGGGGKFGGLGGKGGMDDKFGGMGGKGGMEDKFGGRFGGKEDSFGFGTDASNDWGTASLEDDELGELSGLFGDGEDGDDDDTDWGAFFSRKKRAAKQKNREKRQSNDMEKSGDMEKVFEMMLSGDATTADKVEMMAAMGLTHVLMGLKKKDMRRVPRPVAELPTCLKQILWAPEETPHGIICSALPQDFRMQLRETMMMILKKQGPRSLYGFSQWQEYGETIINLGKKNMMMISLPIDVEDLRQKFIKPLQNLTNNLRSIKSGDKGQDEGDAEALNILNSALEALDSDDILSSVAAIVRDIQGAALMKSAWMMESGEIGEAPKDKDVCMGFAGYVAAGRWREGPHAHIEVPTAWRQENGVISRGDFCPLAARWYWTKVAMCGCSASTCGRRGPMKK